MEDVNLRGMILSKFKTIGAFAESIGWSRNKAGRIVNGQQELTMNDIVEITNTLDLKDRNTFDVIFFPALSTKWTPADTVK